MTEQIASTTPYRTHLKPEAGDELFVTEELIPTLKAKAAIASGGNADVIIATIDGLDPAREFALRMPTVAEYTAYYDAACDSNNADATGQAAFLWTIWPSKAALASARKQMYLLPNRLCDKVERAVGSGKPETFPLTAETDADTLAEHGIPEDIARSLISGNRAPGALRICRITVSQDDAEEVETFSIVTRPLGPSTAQLLRGWQTKAKYNAVKTALGHAIVWPQGSIEKEALFTKYVGLPSPHMFQIMFEQGGSDARISAKKV
jgi:hypothetical protein